MDFNNLFQAIKELSGDKDLVLEDLQKVGDIIEVTLKLVEPLDTMELK